MKTFTYKSFVGKTDYSKKDKIFYGKLEGINDLITFESKGVDKLEKSFHEAVDDYIASCKSISKELH